MAKIDNSVNEKCKNYIKKYARQNKASRELIEKIKEKNTAEMKIIKKQSIEDIVKKN